MLLLLVSAWPTFFSLFVSSCTTSYFSSNIQLSAAMPSLFLFQSLKKQKSLLQPLILKCILDLGPLENEVPP